jgi:hypothetical protein
MTKNEMLAAALTYASWGWAVHPLHNITPAGHCSCGRLKCDCPAKHPRLKDWPDKATVHQPTIRQWWARWPSANIGLCCSLSGLLVIDLDVKNGRNGIETWHLLKRERGFDDSTILALTPSGGQHLFFAANGDAVANSKDELGPGVEVMAAPGNIVLPPSKTGAGAYTWEVSAHPADRKPARLPDELVRLLGARIGRRKSVAIVGDVIPEGRRNETLTSLAGTMRRRGMIESEILAALQTVNMRCRPPLSLSDLQTIAKSVGRYEPGQDMLQQNSPIFEVDRSDTTVQPAAEAIMAPLPDSAQLPDCVSEGASPWLDRYIEFSRRWSPRAYDGFHEAVGLWVLSTVAARRVVLHLGTPRYTPLFIALAARTSLFAKSTTADIGVQVLQEAGLDWMLAADAATPQKFIRDLTTRLPDDFDILPAERQARIRDRLALTGQRGWFYEEFGQQLHAMSRSDGPMSDFRGILRRFDDCKARYESGTIGRGDDVIDRPYLALLANLTPADLRPTAGRGDAMWNDGFWARFAFVTPGDEDRGRGRFPTGERSIPPELCDPLRLWHQRLGVPRVSIADEVVTNGKPTGRKCVQVEYLAPKTCTLGDGVVEHYYLYSDALLDLIANGKCTDLDGNYSRFAEKALRIAILLAALEHRDRIELRHWARGQAIAERWRTDLHRLYNEINAPTEADRELAELRILNTIRRLKRPTIREIAQRLWGTRAAEVKKHLEALVEAGEVVEQETGRTKRYSLSGSQV